MSYDVILLEKANNVHNTGYNIGWGSNCVPDVADGILYDLDDEFGGNSIVIEINGPADRHNWRAWCYDIYTGEFFTIWKNQDIFDRKIEHEIDAHICLGGKIADRLLHLREDGKLPTYRQVVEIVCG